MFTRELAEIKNQAKGLQDEAVAGKAISLEELVKRVDALEGKIPLTTLCTALDQSAPPSDGGADDEENEDGDDIDDEDAPQDLAIPEEEEEEPDERTWTEWYTDHTISFAKWILCTLGIERCPVSHTAPLPITRLPLELLSPLIRCLSPTHNSTLPLSPRNSLWQARCPHPGKVFQD